MKRMALLLLLAAASCSSPDTRQDFSAELDEFIAGQVEPNGPGGAVLVMKDTSVVLAKGYGLADLASGEKITPQTLFNLGSISKTFVAYGILILQAEGKLSVNDSLEKYFPEFKNKEIARRVRIKHLLTHTSGLPDNRQVNRDTVFYLTANDAQNWHPVTQTDTLVFEPGTQYEYSNPAFNGLALIIEQVSGMKWQAFIAQRIFQPSGMISSTITDGAHPTSGVAHGYTRIGGKWREDDFGEEPTFCAAGNGGVWSSVEELARYELALRKATFLDGATIDSSAIVKKFPQWTSPEPPFIGWSWFIDRTPDGHKVICHTGHQGGFAAYYISVPSQGILAVVLYNAPYDVYAFRERLFMLLASHGWLEGA
ncbi:MAG: beta-lactamase family protein [Cyclobacteriaceae bacterium]|nr:beta-lactamase family protein [Cyclobacteriaceae bacterium]